MRAYVAFFFYQRQSSCFIFFRLFLNETLYFDWRLLESPYFSMVDSNTIFILRVTTRRISWEIVFNSHVANESCLFVLYRHQLSKKISVVFSIKSGTEKHLLEMLFRFDCRCFCLVSAPTTAPHTTTTPFEHVLFIYSLFSCVTALILMANRTLTTNKKTTTFRNGMG